MIYIPLCFYFIETAEHRQRPETNLHSTMLLLYQKRNTMQGSRKPIYIPLCFYFIRNHIIYAKHQIYLHSTMLLLYHIIPFVKIPNFAFTFHYASTLSRGSLWYQVHVKGFTFHYASTLSGVRS